MVRKADIEDPELLRSATVTFAPGASSRAADDNMLLLDDDLLDAQYVALQMESHHRLGVFMEVISSTHWY